MSDLRDKVFNSVKKINKCNSVIDKVEDKREEEYRTLNKILFPIIFELGVSKSWEVSKVNNNGQGYIVDLESHYREDISYNNCFIPNSIIDAEDPILDAKEYKIKEDKKKEDAKKQAILDNAKREIERLKKILGE